MYQVKNISGGLLVCTLSDKETTLRVNNKSTVSVEDGLMTPHIFNLEKKKLVKLFHTEDEDKKTVSAASAVQASADKEV